MSAMNRSGDKVLYDEGDGVLYEWRLVCAYFIYFLNLRQLVYAQNCELRKPVY